MQIINLSKFNGDLKQVVKCDRSSILGNPFLVGNGKTRAHVISAFREWLWENHQANSDEIISLDRWKEEGFLISDKYKPASSEDVVSELGKLLLISQRRELILGCWCVPYPCHCQVIVKYLTWRKDQPIEF